MSDHNAKSEEQDSAELFPGDQGTLPEPVRRVLVSLLRNSYISYERNSEGWLHLVEYQQSVKSALNNLFLELHLDERNEIAYCVPVESAGTECPKLKREHELTETQSLLVIFLRQQYLSQASAGAENVWIDGDEMREHLKRLYSEGIVNHARSKSTINSTIEYLSKQHYIEKVSGSASEDRYRILPIIETAFPLEKIRAIREAYEKAAGTGGANSIDKLEGEQGE